MKHSAWEEVFPAVVPDGVTRWHHATSRITCRPWPGEIMSFSQPECPRETTNNSTESQGGKRKKLLLDRRQWKEQEAQRITQSRLDAERSVDCLSCLMCRCWWFGARTEAVRLKSFIKFRRGKGMGFFFLSFFQESLYKLLSWCNMWRPERTWGQQVFQSLFPGNMTRVSNIVGLNWSLLLWLTMQDLLLEG